MTPERIYNWRDSQLSIVRHYSGKYPSYEHLSVRLDMAASERCDQLEAALRGDKS